MISTDYLPLDHLWPRGAPKTSAEKRLHGSFKVEPGKALQDLAHEIERWGASHAVIGTDLPLGRSGKPFGWRDFGGDPGIALQLAHRGQPLTFYADRFLEPHHNLRAIGLTLESLRAIERYGGGQVLEAMMTGLGQLPPPNGHAPHWDLLGLQPGASPDAIEAAFRAKAKTAHPDKGGSAEAFRMLNEARLAALAEIGA